MSWSKTIPQEEGAFHCADRAGFYGGVRDVVLIDGIYRDVRAVPWKGWWWVVPVEEPPRPPVWEGD